MAKENFPSPDSKNAHDGLMAMRKMNDDDRSEAFKTKRGEITTQVGDLLRDLKNVKDDSKKLKNGMPIQDGTSKRRTELADEGATKKVVDELYEGAFLSKEAEGKSRFEMTEQQSDGSVRHVAIVQDGLEAAFGVKDIGTPTVVTGIHEEVHGSDGKQWYFRADIMSDGDVRFGYLDRASGVHKRGPASEADLEAMQPLIGSVRSELI